MADDTVTTTATTGTFGDPATANRERSGVRTAATRIGDTFGRASTAVVGRVLRPVYFRVEHRVDVRFDERAGIETVQRAHLDDLTIDSDNTEFGDDEEIYVAVPVLALRAMNRILPKHVDDFVFVDFGSGKGRILVHASRRPFRRIVGIEFASELHDVASANVANGRHPRQQCEDIEVRHGDAVDFEIPDEPCVFFLFNPFERPVLDRVVANIVDSYTHNPRPMYVVYHNPRYAAAFEESGLFEEVWSRQNSRRSECYDVIGYRARPRVASVGSPSDEAMLQVGDDLRGGR